MKIQPRQIDAFLKKPDPAVRVILLYGPDHGLMSERSDSLARTVVADVNDPFNVAVLSAGTLLQDPARLMDEAYAISMMGGNRLIRIEDAGDTLTPLLKDYLQKPSAENLVLIEAGELAAKSSLRKTIEGSAIAAALPCYIEEGASLSGLIRDMLRDAGLQPSRDALEWLASNLAGDRQRVRREIEKLTLYIGDVSRETTLADVLACCGEAGNQSLDDLVFDTAGARSRSAIQAYNVLIQEGIPVIAILRALQNHFRRLHFAKALIGSGLSTEIAMKKLSPPVFFKYESPFRAQLQRWTLPALERTLNKLAALEAQCKKTGIPADTLCAQALLSISAGRP